MADWVEVQDRYYRNEDGTIRHERWIGGRCVEWNGMAPVVLVDWSTVEAIWTQMIKRPTEIVRKGPKAIVKYVDSNRI